MGSLALRMNPWHSTAEPLFIGVRWLYTHAMRRWKTAKKADSQSGVLSSPDALPTKNEANDFQVQAKAWL
jgi:hypothetical protein